MPAFLFLSFVALFAFLTYQPVSKIADAENAEVAKAEVVNISEDLDELWEEALSKMKEDSVPPLEDPVEETVKEEVTTEEEEETELAVIEEELPNAVLVMGGTSEPEAVVEEEIIETREEVIDVMSLLEKIMLNSS